ncbi:MAG: hypothetical protein GX940_09135 [Clostridiaceae bacterium]|nr:hypothetical protein [Clostridiaceae bacterium]
MSERERQLLKTAKNGGIKAFEELTAPHQRIVYNYLLISCGNEYEACQLTQDVFVKVFELLTSHVVNDDLFPCIYRTAAEVRRRRTGASKMIS